MLDYEPALGMGKDVAALPSRAMLPVAGALPDRLSQR